ncbi:MAG TPA: DNA polymerase III subunit gamma/tau [Opitutaceae bacterium]|jgi:DNA polymerase-3 subunit delta'|nr:DNA polymerase III subunit gamma/tau [Opitutaceae bacterium]
MTFAATTWPPALAGTPAVAVIERALERQRLAHSLLLHGDDHDTLVAIAHAIADRLLNGPGATAKFSPAEHPDCFNLRPAGKMRQISAEAMRGLIGKVQVSPAVAPRKVAIIHEADRLHLAAANIFLKTLEEPPPNTTILLLTTRPYALLPTIRSRVLHFRFPSATTLITAAGWPAWLDDYRAWLGRLADGVTDKRAATGHILALYGLVARFGKTLDDATSAALAVQKEKLSAELGEDEQIALETGLANGLRARLLAEIETATSAFALPRLSADNPERSRGTSRALTAAVENLEHATGLLRLNLNESAALEDFLLTSLRLWTRR